MGKLNFLLLILLLVAGFIHSKNIQNKQLAPSAYFKLLLGDSNGNNRIVYMDYVRVLAAFFVVALHGLEACASGLTAGSSSWMVVQIFSAPFLLCNILFVMSSGSLILNGREESLFHFYSKRAAKVGIPFLCYYSIYILISDQYFQSGFFNGIISSAKQMLAGPIIWTPHFWVIYVIISLYVLAPFYRIMVKNLSDHMLEALVFLIFLFQGFSTYLPFFHLSMGFELPLPTWGCVFLLGYYFNHPSSLKRARFFIISGAASYLFSIFYTFFAPETYQTLLYMDGTPTMLFMAGAIFLLLRKLELKLPHPGFLLRFFSKYSYSILLIHWAVLFFVRDQLRISEVSFGIAGGTIFSTLITLLLSAAVAVFFDQTVVLCIQTLFWNIIGLKKRELQN